MLHPMVQMAAVMAGAVISACIVYQLWGKDLTLPLDYFGDSMSSFRRAKCVADGDWINFLHDTAPFADEAIMSPQGMLLHVILIKLLSIVSGNAILAVNLYHLLTFGLIAGAAFFALKKMRVSAGVSAILAIIYANLPYHYIRGEMHLYLASYYLVPLACLALYWIWTGAAADGHRRRLLFSAIVAFLLGLSDIYYSAFFLFACAAAVLLRMLVKFSKKEAACGFAIMISNIVALVAVMLPTILYNMQHEGSMALADRALGDIDTYALKFIYMILPVSGHRIDALAAFRKLCDTSFPLNNENGTASLGIVLACGLLLSLYFLFILGKEKKSYQREAAECGKINLLFILLASAGGLSTMIAGLLTTSIRSYNRVSIFIAFFSAAAIGFVLDAIKCKLTIFHRYGIMWMTLLLFIGTLGIWDATSADYAGYVSYNTFTYEWTKSYPEMKRQMESDRIFAERIQQSVGEDADILQLPIVSDTIYSSFPNGVGEAYRHFGVRLYTKGIRWSYGAWVGSENDRWLTKVKGLPISRLVDTAAYVGFEGIYFDSKGYDDEKELKKQIRFLERRTGAKAITSKNGELYFINIESYVNELKQSMGDKFQEEANYWLYELPENIQMFAPETLYFTGKRKIDTIEGTFQLGSKAMQFGPYASLASGTYEVKIEGQGLEHAEVWCTGKSGKTVNPIVKSEQSDAQITYYVTIAKDQTAVEFLLKNTGEDALKVFSLQLSKPDKYQFRAKQLNYQQESFDDAQHAVLEKGNIQFGPYLCLDSGKYEVRLRGDHLSDAAVRCTSRKGKKTIETNLLKHEKTEIVYEIVLEKDESDVEFLLENSNGSAHVTLDSLTIERCDEKKKDE